VSTMESTKVQMDPDQIFPTQDILIRGIYWLTDGHDRLIYRAWNRIETLEKLVAVEVPSGTSSILRKRDGSNGWLSKDWITTDSDVGSQVISFIGPVRDSITGRPSNQSY